VAVLFSRDSVFQIEKNLPNIEFGLDVFLQLEVFSVSLKVSLKNALFRQSNYKNLA
jgi:hypothetical protein